MKPDFAARAERYDESRPLWDGWYALADRLIEEADLRGRRVLDVGCGTGRLLAALAERAHARVWGVDPEPRMLEVAQRRLPRGGGLKEGRAEELPFRDGWFERLVFWLSIHLVDRPAAFSEAARVLRPDGRLALVTFEPEHFERHWVNAFLPSLQAVDRARFPTPEQLEAELPAAGFAPPRFVPVRDEGTLTRARALEQLHAGPISTFDLLDPREIAAGIERAERELPERIAVERRWLLVVADRAEE